MKIVVFNHYEGKFIEKTILIQMWQLIDERQMKNRMFPSFYLFHLINYYLNKQWLLVWNQTLISFVNVFCDGTSLSLTVMDKCTNTLDRVWEMMVPLQFGRVYETKWIDVPWKCINKLRRSTCLMNVIFARIVRRQKSYE